MKKLIMVIIALALAGCTTDSTFLEKRPDELPNYTFQKVDGEMLAVQRASGERIVVTKDEYRLLRKLPSDVAEAAVKQMFAKRDRVTSE